MRSPGLAIAWEFHRRHRWGLIALAGYLFVLAAIKLLILGPGQPVKLDPPDGRAALVIAPVSVTFFYYLAVFSFGLAGDLAGRHSIFPARMFALPVTTKALAGWPMLCGAVVMASLWLGTALFARWPWGIDLPLIWPALLAATFLAWTQALTWMPYGVPGLRVIVTVLWLAALDAVVLLAIHFKAPEPVMVAILAPQLPLAYLAARFAVARARRGDVPEWRGRFVRRPVADVPPVPADRFPSPERAQLWFEWRRHGRTLPTWVGILLPFELALLWVVNDTPALVFETLLIVLITPPFMAALVAATVGKAHPDGRDSYSLTPFVATRPSTSAALIAAKLKMTIWTTLGAWLLVLVAILLGLTMSGTWPTVNEWARQCIEVVGAPRAIVVLLLGFAGLLASTWKQLVQSLYLGLTGREWLIKTHLFLVLSFVVVIGPVAQWIHDNRDVQGALWEAVPWILAVLVGLKMSAAAWVATRLHRSRLLGDRALVTGAASWCVAVLALYGLFGWLVSGPLIPRYFLVLLAILAMPLARLSAAPLALAWNRHR